MSIAAFGFGKDLVNFMTIKYWRNRKKRIYNIVPTDFRKNVSKMDVACAVIGVITWIAVIVLAIVWREHRQILFSTAFGPVGKFTKVVSG
jgi:hypothetical protein